jgi:signal transduction histidine kinase
MFWRQMRDLLFPRAAESDDAFRQEVVRASHRGLPTVGAVEIASALLLLPRIAQPAAMAWLGLLTILISRVRWSQSLGRQLAIASAALALIPIGWAGGDRAQPAAMAVLLATVVAVPLLPVHAAMLAVSAELVYLWLAPGHDLFLWTLGALGIGIAAVLYRRRTMDWRERQESLRVAEALAGAQLRAQLAESAAAIGKLAAAVTHEINTPLGSLASAVDTLLVVASRQATAPPEQQARLVTMQADLRKSLQAATDRIRGVITRLQRFIGLEEAELRPANVNELIGDVATLFGEETRHGVQVQFDFQPVPMLMCRPQLLTAVFSSLLSNAINASNGDGRIVVGTRRAGAAVEIEIRDNGRGMSAEQIENIFDPGFKVSGSRIASGNWSLFNARQIIFEHGGDIRISSAEGEGTTVCVTLPA